MSVNLISALQNGHFGPLRSVYALSEAVSRNARFLMRYDSESLDSNGSRKVSAKRTKCSRWMEQAITIHFGLIVFSLY